METFSDHYESMRATVLKCMPGVDIDLIDKALEKIEPYKTSDPVLYEKLRDRITLESISFRYMQIYLYELLYSSADRQEMIKSFKDDCMALGITQYKEGIGYADGGSLESYLEKL